MNNRHKISVNLLQDDDVDVVDVDGKEVVIINVPRDQYYERLVFISRD